MPDNKVIYISIDDYKKKGFSNVEAEVLNLIQAIIDNNFLGTYDVLNWLRNNINEFNQLYAKFLNIEIDKSNIENLLHHKLIRESKIEDEDQIGDINFHGQMNKHPLLVSLHMTLSADNTEMDLLRIHLIAAQYILIRKLSDGNPSSALRNSAWALRELVTSLDSDTAVTEKLLKESSYFLPNCDVTKLTVPKFENHKKLFSNYIRGLKYAQKNEKGQTRSSRSTRTKQSKKFREEENNQIQIKTKKHGLSEITVEKTVPKFDTKLLKEAEKEGVSPHELCSDVTTHKTILKPNTNLQFQTKLDKASQKSQTQGKSLRSIIQQTQAIIKNEKIHNQLLYNDWRRLTDFEVRIFLSIAFSMTNDFMPSTSTEEGKIINSIMKINHLCLTDINHIGLIILYSFYFCLKPKQVQNLRYIKNHKFLDILISNDREYKFGEWIYSLEKHTWHLKLIQPEYFSELPLKQKNNLEKTEKVLNFSIANQLTKLTNKLIHLNNRTTKARKKFIFDSRDYEKIIMQLYSEINKKFNTRLNINRVSSEFFFRIVDTTQNQADAILLTGYEFDKTFSSLYYYTPSINNILKIHEKAINNLPIDQTLFDNKNTQQINDKYARIGARTLIKEDALINLVLEMNKKLDGFRQKLDREVENLANFHNFYTAYTVLLLQFFTAYRPVNSIINDRNLWNDLDGYLLISDKDQIDNYHTRLIFLHPTVTQQLEFYEKHRILVLSQLKMFNLIKFKDNDNDIDPFIFLIDNKFNAKKAMIGDIWYMIDKEHHILRNYSRNFLYTNLTAQGVPSNYLENFLGHWKNGQEGFSKLSSLNGHKYSQTIIPAINKISKKFCWQAERGLNE